MRFASSSRRRYQIISWVRSTAKAGTDQGPPALEGLSDDAGKGFFRVAGMGPVAVGRFHEQCVGLADEFRVEQNWPVPSAQISGKN